MGSPGKVVRELTEAQRKCLKPAPPIARANAQRYARDLSEQDD